MEKRPAVFLDRDGVINPLIYHRDHGIVDSPFTLRQFSVLPGVPRAIRLLNDLGFVVVIASNQPGIAKGHFEPELIPKIERRMRAALRPAGARVDATYYCLHHPEATLKKYRSNCDCRKPAPGQRSSLRKASRRQRARGRSRDGGFAARVADACVIVPVINQQTITPHTESFQSLVLHLMVSHPRLKAVEMKWESSAASEPAA